MKTGNCVVCGEDFDYLEIEEYGEVRCTHCGTEYQYEEGHYPQLSDEEWAAVLDYKNKHYR